VSESKRPRGRSLAIHPQPHGSISLVECGSLLPPLAAGACLGVLPGRATFVLCDSASLSTLAKKRAVI